jgi:hypothetical protein
MNNSTAVSLTVPSLASDARHRLLEDQPLVSLYEVFTTLVDPRSKHGQRYDLPYLLTCLVAALRMSTVTQPSPWGNGVTTSTICCGDCSDHVTFSAHVIRSIANCSHVWMLNRSNTRSPTGYVVPCKPKQMIRSLWMAKPFVEPGRRKGWLPTCSLSARITVRKPYCRWQFLRRPMRSQWPKRSCLVYQWRDGSSRLTRYTRRKTSCSVWTPWVAKPFSRSKTINRRSQLIWPPILLILTPLLKRFARAISIGGASRRAPFG